MHPPKSNTEGPFGVNLTAQPQIGQKQNPILGPGPMIPRMLTEILQLLKRAAPQRLPQKQKQPINLLLLLTNHRAHATLGFAQLTLHQNRTHPHFRRPLPHPFHVFRHEIRHFMEPLLQIVLHTVSAVAFLALHVSTDEEDLLGMEVPERVHHAAPVAGPGVRWRDGGGFSRWWGSGWAATRAAARGVALLWDGFRHEGCVGEER